MLLYRDPLFHLHRQAPGHPERPERLEAIDRMLADAPLACELRPGECRDATFDEIARVHSREYIRMVAASGGVPHTQFDGDTSANGHSYAAACRAAGSAIAAVDAVLEGPDRRAFVLSRPPGHHAEATHAAGFCFFNTAAIAAEHALASGLSRVCILDWDVHHGNGSMHSFYDRNDVLYASVHEYPHYPGTGRLGDIGRGSGEGYTVTAPLPAGCGDAEYLHVMTQLIYPIARAFAPELVLVSAGYDGHRRDPLASMRLSSQVYGLFTTLDCMFADTCTDGRLVYLLEGGYDTDALAEGVRESMTVLCGGRAAEVPDTSPHAEVVSLTDRLLEQYQPYWPAAEAFSLT
ncbi:MAG: histone deacetylase [Spirochaetaceae bacterium]|nr:MAG: histone deacetylase [Spirochaetaceae bacterium]